MAKKRLNKKVVLIGTVVFAILALAAIGVILHLSRDPDKFIEDGNAAVQAGDYEKAERCYHKARSLAKTDSLRIEVLFKLVDDVYLVTDQWNFVLGCWDKIINLDPKNIRARFGRLKYVYIMADNGASNYWKEVASQAGEFIELVEKEGLFDESTEPWESFGIQEVTGIKKLGPYLYLLRGRANLEMAMRGAVTDPDKLLARAMEDLEKVRKVELQSVDAYLYLAQAAVTKGDILASRGDIEGKDKAGEQAIKLLEEAVKVASDNPKSHINLLNMKLRFMFSQAIDREQLKSVEPEYLSLVKKFGSSSEAFSALSGFYMQLGHKNLDQAINAVEKAIELDKEEVGYATRLAYLLYQRFSIYGQKQDILKAVEVASNALTLPNAQDKPGPRSYANKGNRLSLCVFLANCYIEQVLEPERSGIKTESEKQELIAKAEQSVHEIEQLVGSGENPEVAKWQGMLELAKGNVDSGVRKMFAAYEQWKSVNRKDFVLSYRLAKIFENTVELGAANEFYLSALSIPVRAEEKGTEAFLDYGDVLLKLRYYGDALGLINFFEQQYWVNERSQAIRINALIGAKEFDKAEEQLAKLESEDANTIKLRCALVRAKIEQIKKSMAHSKMQDSSEPILQELSEKEKGESPANVELMMAELTNYKDVLAGLMAKLLEIEPNFVDESLVIAVCDNYMVERKYKQAEAALDQALKYYPKDTMMLFYKSLLSQQAPEKLSEPERKQMTVKILEGIDDPTLRTLNLGIFYQTNNEPNKAAEEFKKILKLEDLQDVAGKGSASEQTEESAGLQKSAGRRLFDIVLEKKDWYQAEKIVDFARRTNMDDFGGNYVDGRLALAREQHKEALAKIDECLKQRPVSSDAYLLRSKINAALGNELESIKDIRKAASLNPLEGVIARGLALALYDRIRKLGDKAVPEEVVEVRAALDRALALNPGDWNLLSFYAEFISRADPSKALAIRQTLQKANPNMENTLLLGELATRMALNERDADRKEALFGIAASAFEQARAINPSDKALLYNYAEYYRARGQEEKAEQLLVGSNNQTLLWNHYFARGEFEKAKKVLDQLYQTDPKDKAVVRGLVLIAERTADEQSVRKYSEELLSLEESSENRIVQIQVFLNAGLIEEAENKLESCKEKYPDEPRLVMLEALLAMKQGKLKRALELTNQHLENNQNDFMAWKLRGEINLFMANSDEAINSLKKSLLLSDNPATRITLAKAYMQMGREEDAITELKNVIDYPQVAEEGRVLLEELYWRLGRKGELKSFYEEILKKLPDSVHWYNRAGALAVAEGDFGRAEQMYGQAWQRNKKSDKGDAEEALNGYLQSLLLSGKLDKVFEEAGKYVDSDFASVAFIGMAEAKARGGDKATALQYCEKAVDKAGSNETLESWVLQRMYILLGAEEVLSYCQERLSANPDLLAPNFTMYNLTRMSGEYNKAVDYINKCLQIVGPDHPSTTDYIIKKALVLQQAYSKTSDNKYLKESIEEYESLLAKMPNNTEVLNNLAYLLAENGERLPQALECAKQAHEIKPNNADFLDTYAYLLYKNGRLQEAAEFIQAALQQYSKNKVFAPGEVYEHLGMIKEKLGAKEEAIVAYRQALEVGAGKLSNEVNERIKSAIERVSQ